MSGDNKDRRSQWRRSCCYAVHGIPFTGEDLAAMSSTGKPVADFFRPLSQMRNGSHQSWTCF
eukprot:8554476-Pyramimonas_sp.AAC.1